jgi:dihydrolipoamide dehydrogenase
LGAGPGGYVAAIRAAQLGQKVAIIDRDRPGGVCLNWGCIPTKAGITLDYAKALAHSRRTSDRLCKGIQSLFKKNQIEFVSGAGRIAGPNRIDVSGDGPDCVEADRLIIATGSGEFVPPGVHVDGTHVLTSREALESPVIPDRLVIIGAGAVGIEFAYVYAMYGARVTVIEMADQVLPGADVEVSAALQREFRRKNIDVRLNTRFEGVKSGNGSVRVAISQQGVGEELEANQLLLAIGRRPLAGDIGLEASGVATDERGFVRVDAELRTSIPSIAAIGDVAGAPLLAHKASEEGIAAVEFGAGMKRHALDHKKIPGCIYSQPQVAWIGLTEAEARAQYGDEIRVGKFPFTASGKAIASTHTAGFTKIIAEPRYGEIVGAHIVGHGATELIAEIGLAMTLEATTAEIAGTCHAHPTLAEAILEATLAAEGRSINF